jgi:hypothetical protein
MSGILIEDMIVRADEVRPTDSIIAVSPNNTRNQNVTGVDRKHGRILISVDYGDDHKLQPDRLVVVGRHYTVEELDARDREEEVGEKGTAVHAALESLDEVFDSVDAAAEAATEQAIAEGIDPTGSDLTWLDKPEPVPHPVTGANRRSQYAGTLAAVISGAHVQARDLYVAGARSVLRHCPSLDHYIDAMGAQFFVRTNGETVHDDSDLPPTARQFLDDTAGLFFETFGSLGWKVYRDHIVKDW